MTEEQAKRLIELGEQISRKLDEVNKNLEWVKYNTDKHPYHGHGMG